MTTSLVLGVVGGIAGSFFGMPQIGFAIGSAIGAAIDPPAGPDQMGPRLNDLSVQNSSYGVFIPIVYGSYRLSGNVIWSEDIKETKHEEEIGGKGGDSATSTTFTYSCSFAVSLCEGGDGAEAVTLRRIFADGRLIYDGSNQYVAPEDYDGETVWSTAIRILRDEDDEDGALSNTDFVFYGGGEEQLPDPLMESILGVGNVPAYRGQCYIVFTDLPLAKFGNRIPNMSFEIVKNGRYEQDLHLDNFVHPLDGDYAITCVYNPIRDEVWEFSTALPRVIRRSPHSGDILGYIDISSVASSCMEQYFGNPTFDPVHGYIYCGAYGPTSIIQFDAVNATVVTTFSWGPFAVSPVSGDLYWTPVEASVRRLKSRDTQTGMVRIDISIHAIFATQPSFVFEDNGNFWLYEGDPVLRRFDQYGNLLSTFNDSLTPATPTGIGNVEYDKDRESLWYTSTNISGYKTSRTITGITLGTTTVITFAAGTGPGFVVGQSVTITDNVTGCTGLWDGPEGDEHTIIAVAGSTVTLSFDSTGFPAWTGGGVIKTGDCVIKEMSIATGTVQRIVLTGARIFSSIPALRYDADRRCLWVAHDDDDLTAITLVRTGDGTIARRLAVLPYYGIAWWCMARGNMWYQIDSSSEEDIYRINLNDFIDTQTSNLAYIARDIALRCDLADERIDVDQLVPEEVRGYAITSSMSGRAGLESLMNGFVFDCCDSDGVVKFVKRGGTPVVVIPSSNLVDKEGTAILINRKQETELPASISLAFRNPIADYQTGLQKAQRGATYSSFNSSMELSIVFSDFEARQVTERLLYNAWIERNAFSYGTARRYAYLEPTDIVTLWDEDENVKYNVRIQHKSESRNGQIDFQGVANEAALYRQKTTTGSSLPPSQAVTVVGMTQTVMLDIPMLRDQDTGVGVYVGMNGFGAIPFSGATLFKSADSGASYSTVTTLTVATPIGRATTALPTWEGANILDEASTVNVMLERGTLSSVDYLAVLNGGNAAALRSGTGWEILHYRDATLELDGSYTLSGLLRGRRGTEWAMSSHAVGDTFVPLSETWLTRLPLESSETGLSRRYKAVSSGQLVTDAYGFNFTNTSESQECYSPVHIGGGRAANTVTINWVRRTRINGSWHDFSDSALNEETEAYEVEIWNSTYTTLKRTITGLSTATTTYSSADQITDFGSNQSTVYVKVFQLSATNGRGHEARGTV